MSSYAGLPSNQGMQGKSGNFIFNRGKSREKKRYFEISGIIREVLNKHWFHFREVTLYTQPCIQLSATIAKFSPCLKHFILCSHFEVQFPIL